MFEMTAFTVCCNAMYFSHKQMQYALINVDCVISQPSVICSIMHLPITLEWLGGVVVRSRTSDSEVADSSPTMTAVE